MGLFGAREGKKPRYGGGPHNVGDPDDRSLRKIESKVMIPQFMREIVRDEYCAEEIKKLSECIANSGLLLSRLKCKSIKHETAQCLDIWNEREEVHKKALETYLGLRRLYRLTGKSKEEREYEEKLKMKNQQMTE